MSKDTNINIKNILLKVLKIPGVKIDRKKFLTNIFSNEYPNEKTLLVIKEGPIKANISKEEINKLSNMIIKKETIISSSASLMFGIPGGITQAVTIPTDIIQFFAISLRLCQKLCYLYGFEDIWDGYEDIETVDRFILFIGVMFGIAGANETVRIMTSAFSKTILKKMPQRPLWNKLYSPIINNISKVLGIKLSNKGASSITKAIPIVGGLISGTVTYLSMKPMGENLRNVLEKANFNYSDKDLYTDLKFIDVDFEVNSKDF
ncbi:MAG: bacteriochlorophyll 4-vinyl reductase [Clostridium sp.]|nr:bacteriochlorophyll 4-vinyl reductase [Clostridium sp.]